MSSEPNSGQLDRYTEFGELTQRVRKTIRHLLLPIGVILVAETSYLAFTGQPGDEAFAAMSLGTWITLAIWSSSAIGLPLLPMMSIQALIIYGIPIVASHEVILKYPREFVIQSGIEVMTFQIAMCAAWSVGMRLISPSPPVSHTLHEFNKSGVKGWAKVGFTVIVCVTTFEILQGLNVLGGVFAMLPGGSESIITALLAVAGACGFFLVALVVGCKEANITERIVFWGLLIANGMIASEDFILSSTGANIIMVAIGLFWSSSKPPWRYLTVAVLALSFLNMGKTTMRTRYWETEDSPGSQFGVAQLPSVYLEWIGVSYDAMVENNTSATKSADPDEPGHRKNQTLLDRIDNLQNLLFVIDAEETNHIPPLEGKTYSIIPPLLIPRILWPDKPRSHEGQILLNVHFGRQDLASTFTTYIAWGLLPEAYGNFGPLLGSIIIGCFLGAFFAWIENFTARKLVVSLEGFIFLSATVSLMNSFEMVASVLVTSTFQSLMIIFGAFLPFVRRARNPMRVVPDE